MSTFLRCLFVAVVLSAIAGSFAVAGGHDDPRTCDDHAFRHCR